MRELLEAARAVGAVSFSGIATEVFRKAANGSQLLKRLQALGLPINIISQQEEGHLGK